MKAPSQPIVKAAVEHAFTRIELTVILAVLCLTALVVLPALANTRPRSHRVICLNNLRQIGVAQHLWGNEHDDLPPLMVATNLGGTRQHFLAANTWLHFAWLSNELRSPKLVFCPSDTGKAADDFTGNPNSGYLHPNFADRATSYFTSYSSFNADPQNAVMNGDRNVTFDQPGVGCSLLNWAYSISGPQGNGGQWKTGLHEFAGNVQFRDGRVAMLSSAGLRAAMIRPLDDNSSKHIAIPR